MDQTANGTAAIQSLQPLLHALQTGSGPEIEWLCERLNLLAEACHEQELQGCGDLLCLLAEQVEAEAELTRQQADDLQQLLTLLQTAATPAPLLTHLQQAHTDSEHWSQPLEPEDLELLPELLQQEWPQLQPRAEARAPATDEADDESDSANVRQQLQNCLTRADSPETLAEGLAGYRRPDGAGRRADRVGCNTHRRATDRA
jgi:hypothetical protein